VAEIYLVRHGQASFGADNYDQLSALGEQQSLWLGEHFAQRAIRFDRVIIGTQLRHSQTVARILQGLGQTLAVEQHAGLNEYDFIALHSALGNTDSDPGMPPYENRRDYYRTLKQALKLWSEGKLTGPLPETWEEFVDRVGNALRSIQQSAHGRVLVVSSGGPIAVAAQRVLQAPSVTAIELNFQIRNTSVCQFFFNGQSIRLATFNTIPHLDRHDRAEAITFA
jgi:broad specificity phosphatase PhoE